MKLTKLKTTQIVYWTSNTLLFVLFFYLTFWDFDDYKKSSPTWSFLVFATLCSVIFWSSFKVEKLKEANGELIRFGKVFKLNGNCIMAILVSFISVAGFILHALHGVFILNQLFLFAIFWTQPMYYPIQYDVVIFKETITQYKSGITIYFKNLMAIELSEQQIAFQGKFNRHIVIELAKYKELEQQKIVNDIRKLKLKLGV